MKAGKREDRLFLIIQAVSLLPRYNASFFGHQDIPDGFFSEPERQQQNATL
ncbi:MAG: hypothetical protein ACYDGO_05660 [Smithellaceae bacterium]